MRLARFGITGETLNTLLRGAKAESDVPPTAEFLFAKYEANRSCFSLYFQDESFDEVQPGDEIPVLGHVQAVGRPLIEVFDDE